MAMKMVMTQKILTEKLFVKTAQHRKKRHRRGHNRPMCNGINGKGCLATPVHQKMNQNTQKMISSKFRSTILFCQYCLAHLIWNNHMFSHGKKKDKNYVLSKSGESEYYQINVCFIFSYVSSFQYRNDVSRSNYFKDLNLKHLKEQPFQDPPQLTTSQEIRLSRTTEANFISLKLFSQKQGLRCLERLKRVIQTDSS